MTALAPEDRVLTIPEAAEILRFSKSKTRRLAQTGELPGVLPKIGGTWRISESALRRYLSSGADPVGPRPRARRHRGRQNAQGDPTDSDTPRRTL